MAQIASLRMVPCWKHDKIQKVIRLKYRSDSLSFVTGHFSAVKLLFAASNVDWLRSDVVFLFPWAEVSVLEKIQLQEYNKTAIRETMDGLGISNLESFTVDHCANAYGLSLTSKDGWKLVFSGDTRPCKNVVQAAQNALVLIHEVL